MGNMKEYEKYNSSRSLKKLRLSKKLMATIKSELEQELTSGIKNEKKAIKTALKYMASLGVKGTIENISKNDIKKARNDKTIEIGYICNHGLKGFESIILHFEDKKGWCWKTTTFGLPNSCNECKLPF